MIRRHATDLLILLQVDQSYFGSEQTLRKRFGDEEAEKLMSKRWGKALDRIQVSHLILKSNL